MDHQQFDVAGDDFNSLAPAIALAFQLRRCSGKDYRGHELGVTHYAIREPFDGLKENGGFSAFVYGQEAKPRRMVFFKLYPHSANDKPDRIPFPFMADAAVAAEFAMRWLKECDYPREPDTDGSTKKGWRVYSERWGRIDDDHSSIIAVAPLWAVYGK